MVHKKGLYHKTKNHKISNNCTTYDQNTVALSMMPLSWHNLSGADLNHEKDGILKNRNN